MAQVGYIHPVDKVTGKLSKSDDVYFRMRNGKRYAVKMINPRTEFSDKEKVLHARFGDLSKQASAIAKDPELAAPYMAGYEAQKETEGGKQSLYHYVLSQLTRK